MVFRPPPSPFVLIEDNRAGHPQAGGWWFDQLQSVIECNAGEDVLSCLAEVDAALAAGHHVAGYIGYEAGLALEDRLDRLPRHPGATPLLSIGVWGRRRWLDAATIEAWLDAPSPSPYRHRLSDFRLGIERDAYLDAIARIQEYIRAGDVYQVNFTFPCSFTVEGDALGLYRQLRRAQRVAHGALIATGDRTILSLSPELFFSLSGDELQCRPMKGTAERGLDQRDDEARASQLRDDPKSRAENLMIVDLIRNDLARVAVAGSVAVTRLFEVEAYQTLLQMTSSIRAGIRQGLGFSDLIKALFPCGSVTGAPKIRAMEIIHELEPCPRGVYTGAIGFASPDRQAKFNVPIRTLVIDPDGRGSIGIGSGIVADSVASDEYDECLLKARFLDADWPAFDLFETLGWTPETGFARLDAHLGRIERSARYFGFAGDPADWRTALQSAAKGFGDAPLRVRFSLARSGATAILAAPMPPPPPEKPALLMLATHAIDSRDPLRPHKTSHRVDYDRALGEIRTKGGFEVGFFNERGELCEGSFSNLFLEIDGELLTPAQHCGLLPGILRAELLTAGRCREAVLHLADLERAQAIHIGNALRGLVRVAWAPGNRPATTAIAPST